MPAFVVGFELGMNPRAEAFTALGERLPLELCPYVLLHEHQWHGVECRQVGLLGITLCLEHNLDRPRGELPLDALRRGFVSIGEAGEDTIDAASLHPEVTWMKSLAHPRHPNPYTQDDQRRLESTLGKAVPGLPPLEWAAEAFARFAPGVPEALRGWNALAFSHKTPLELDDGRLAAFRRHHDVAMTDSRLQALEELGQRENLGPVRTFLLWENSD